MKHKENVKKCEIKCFIRKWICYSSSGDFVAHASFLQQHPGAFIMFLPEKWYLTVCNILLSLLTYKHFQVQCFFFFNNYEYHKISMPKTFVLSLKKIIFLTVWKFFLWTLVYIYYINVCLCLQENPNFCMRQTHCFVSPLWSTVPVKIMVGNLTANVSRRNSAWLRQQVY